MSIKVLSGTREESSSFKTQNVISTSQLTDVSPSVEVAFNLKLLYGTTASPPFNINIASPKFQLYASPYVKVTRLLMYGFNKKKISPVADPVVINLLESVLQ